MRCPITSARHHVEWEKPIDWIGRTSRPSDGAEKKSAGRSSGLARRIAAVEKQVVPDHKCPTGILPARIVGDSRIPALIRNRAGAIADSIAFGSASDKVASYHPTQSTNRFQGKFS